MLCAGRDTEFILRWTLYCGLSPVLKAQCNYWVSGTQNTVLSPESGPLPLYSGYLPFNHATASFTDFCMYISECRQASPVPPPGYRRCTSSGWWKDCNLEPILLLCQRGPLKQGSCFCTLPVQLILSHQHLPWSTLCFLPFPVSVTTWIIPQTPFYCCFQVAEAANWLSIQQSNAGHSWKWKQDVAQIQQ